MKLGDIYRQPGLTLSFEIFPPKAETPVQTLFETIERLKDLRPAFISVTYGAGGSQKGRTVEIASKIKNDLKLEAVPHLTCVGHSRADVDQILADLAAAGVENVLALRGDPPAGQPNFDFSRGEFRYATELVRYIRERHDFGIAAAAYPEGHRDCPRISTDWRNLRAKVDAGVDVLVTQLFYDNRVFYQFLETIRGMGIACPVVPGVMPVFNARQIKRILTLCGASLPADLLLLLDKYGESDEDMRKAGIEYAVRQIQDLLANGADGIHLEPMNKADLARDILAGIGYQPRP